MENSHKKKFMPYFFDVNALDMMFDGAVSGQGRYSFSRTDCLYVLQLGDSRFLVC